jgi:hypothetical protein
MSTRSALAYKTGEDKWSGVYCHFDGYPTNRGKQIWEILMKDFILNRGVLGVANSGNTSLQSFVDIYIKGHIGGWSNFPDVCYCHSPEFVQRDGVNENIITSDNPDALFIEWVYVIDVENKKLIILCGGRAKGMYEEKAPDGRKWKSPNYTHYPVIELTISPDLPEPDWEKIQKQGAEISNSYYHKFSQKED